MSDTLPIIYVARHGETAWSLTGQHTGRTDLPLTEHGEHNARCLAPRLQGMKFAKVLTSPLRRAVRTCKLAGFGSGAEIDRDLLELDYGEYEGRRGDDIRKERPDWNLFRDGCPVGESPHQVATRANRVVGRVRAIPGDVLLFSSWLFHSSSGFKLARPRARGKQQALYAEHCQPVRLWQLSSGFPLQ
jgi:broad specificity phosphatase PhoE